MPQAKIVISHWAEADLMAIWLTIAAHDPGTADRMAARLATRIGQLADHPELGPARDDIRKGARHLVEEPYLILYEWQPAANAVEIVRVVHGARDLPGTLERGPR
jgi:toxin ParE1/3/4